MMESSTRERLIPAVRRVMRTRHLSRLTEEAYVRWIVRFVRFHGLRHPRTLGEREVREFLSHLATDRNVAASTQSQALAALLFLYTDVLRDPVPWIADVIRARRPQRLPVVMTREEVRAVLGKMRGSPRVVALLLYGSGLRLMEALQLRVKDIDFGMNQITVRGGKGDRDRVTMLPAAARTDLERQLVRVRRLHARDLAAGAGRTILPHGLARKYPNASVELAWQWVFPAQRLAVDPTTKARCRHPFARDGGAAGDARCGEGGGSDEAGDVSHVSALVRDAFIGGWARHSDGAGAIGSSERCDDDDLHACIESWGVGGAESGRSVVRVGERWRGRAMKSHVLCYSIAARSVTWGHTLVRGGL